MKIVYPSYRHYDVGSGLTVIAATNPASDPRGTEAVDHLEAQHLPDGRWQRKRSGGGRPPAG
jgi:hypothetical protein